jgi:hypothetical protein
MHMTFSHSDNGKCTSIIDCSHFPSLSSSPPYSVPTPHWGGSRSTLLPGPLLPPSPMFVRATALVAMTLGIRCTASSYVFGFGSVKGHFLFDLVALRKLTLIFSGTRGRVGPQGRGSCPANLRRPQISQFSVELWRTLSRPHTWVAQVRRLRGDWYGAKILQVLAAECESFYVHVSSGKASKFSSVGDNIALFKLIYCLVHIRLLAWDFIFKLQTIILWACNSSVFFSYT